MSGWFESKMAGWDRLTEGEKDYLFANPWDAFAIERNSKIAQQEAARRFGKGSLHNGAGDAFRHCYWNALLARDLGKGNAIAFSTAHEGFPNNPAGERDMDLHNNSVGSEIGAAHPHASDGVLSNLCFDALQSGRLKVLKP
ncbi:hypothetical protein M8A51_22240 [Schlegelella sp. S2-27]|uniref:DUF6973 domain-containing protein n=1 Tax=Caldimonas mangrovi TaxID=2944811 RepID=A0ABT0YUG3_9BURK|nr:hypothetical protein [Caldimonas mangrovi]MCM5682258.1 hypothetical protein [Caldimonas mangrovi]